MRFRWIIRGLALLLLLASAGFWLQSYWRWHFLGFRGFAIRSENGSIVIIPKTPAIGVGWRGGERTPQWSLWLKPLHDDLRYHAAGFAYDDKRVTFGGWETVLMVPFWATTLAAALLLWFVWRNTRPRTATAFPVEPANSAQQAQP